MGDKGKEIEITIKGTVDNSATEDQIADRVQEALKPLASNATDIGDISIRTTSRKSGSADKLAAPGYESRLWEKATC
jgi:hypothetical protein